MSDEFIDAFLTGNVRDARDIVDREPHLLEHRGYRANPLLRACVEKNHGHCYKRSHLEIAEWFIPDAVKAWRLAVFEDQRSDVAQHLSNDPPLVHAEFTGGGRGIAQAIHHSQSHDVATLLLDAGADIHACTTVHQGGETPLAVKLRMGDLDAVRFLLDHGADPNRGVSTAIPSSVLNEAIALLKRHGWDMNAGFGRRRTMLHHDANHGHGDRILTWLANGADARVQNDQGQTALHILAARGTGRDAIQALVKAGADVNQRDDNGRTPLDLASDAPKTIAAQELIKLGAKSSTC